MKTQHPSAASAPLAPALAISGELWFPHPRGGQEGFPTVPVPHRGQREPELGQHLSSAPVPFPTSARTHLCSPSGGAAGPEAVSALYAVEGALGGHTAEVRWGMLQAQLGRGAQLPSWGEASLWLQAGLGQSCLTREKRWLGTQLIPCLFLLHRTPPGAKRAWVTHVELSCLHVTECLSALGSRHCVLVLQPSSKGIPAHLLLLLSFPVESGQCWEPGEAGGGQQR